MVPDSTDEYWHALGLKVEKRKLDDETYLPTEQNKTCPNPWIQKKNGNKSGSPRD